MALPKKKIPIINLEIGDTFDSYTLNGTWHGASFEIKGKEKDFVLVSCYGREPEPVSNEAMAEVDYTENELLDKYEIQTLELIKAMEHQLYDQGDAVHEMWNGWVWDPSPAETAINCEKEGLTVIGYFYLPRPEPPNNLDIGVVAEYEDGDRIWCHAKKSWYDNWKKWFPDLYKKIGGECK